jgi:hypothetical protein
VNTPSRAALREGKGPLAFNPYEPGPLYYAYKDTPLAAVAFDEDVLLELFLRQGLVRRNPAQYGSWSGRGGDTFQDIGVFDKGAA